MSRDRLTDQSRVDTLTSSQLQRERVWTCADLHMDPHTGRVTCLGCAGKWWTMTEYEQHARRVGVTPYRGPGPLRESRTGES